MTRKRLVLGVLVVIAALAVTLWLVLRRDSRKDRPPIKVAYAAQVSNLPFFYALENGEFERRGLKIELLPPMLQAPDIVGAVVAGRADAALDTALLSVIQANQRDPGTIKVVLWTLASRDNAFMRIIVPKGSAVQSASDLLGKRLGHFPSPQLRAIGAALALRIGGSAEAITLVPVPPSSILEAMSASEIDAALVLEPIGSIAIARGMARSLVDSPVVNLAEDEVPIGAFFLSRRFTEERPRDAELYVEALEAGCRLLRAHPERAPDFVVKYTVAKDPKIAKVVSFPRNWLRTEEDERKFEYFVELLRQAGVDLPKVTAAQLSYADPE